MAIVRPGNKAKGTPKKGHGGKSQGKGWGGGGGKGGGKGGGSWVFVPAGASFGAPPMWGKGKATGKRSMPTPPWHQGRGMVMQAAPKGFGKGGKGGKALSPQDQRHRDNMDKLSKIEADRKVWVGGLKELKDKGKLVKHFKDLDCNPSIVELMSKGKQAVISFKTADDASTAISIVNGSDLDGQTIEVDVWTKKEKKEGEEPRKRVKKHTLKRPVAKAKGKPAKLSKIGEKIKAVDNELKVWIGGLKESTTWKQVKEHFANNGCEVDMCDIPKPGKGCATFKSADEAASAIAVVNGTDLDGNSIEVDVWSRPERKEKKKKEED